MLLEQAVEYPQCALGILVHNICGQREQGSLSGQAREDHWSPGMEEGPFSCLGFPCIHVPSPSSDWKSGCSEHSFPWTSVPACRHDGHSTPPRKPHSQHLFMDQQAGGLHLPMLVPQLLTTALSHIHSRSSGQWAAMHSPSGLTGWLSRPSSFSSSRARVTLCSYDDKADQMSANETLPGSRHQAHAVTNGICPCPSKV